MLLSWVQPMCELQPILAAAHDMHAPKSTSPHPGPSAWGRPVTWHVPVLLLAVSQVPHHVAHLHHLPLRIAPG